MPEFSPGQLAALETAYQQALYEVYADAQTITIQVNVHSKALTQLLQQCQETDWTLVTAYNPYSQQLSSAENQENSLLLETAIQRLNLPYLPAVGRDSAGVWPPEVSWFAMGIDRQAAIALGKQFSQNAILYGTSATLPQLVWLL
ncbi:MAG: DUF3293 domain-containing protein [Cyanobacteria bacterium J06649_4]